jgi:hypothetical protein
MTDATPEYQLPTIKDLYDRLGSLMAEGLGDLPVHVLAVPDSTLQAIARVVSGPEYDQYGPAYQLSLSDTPEGAPVMLISSERFGEQEHEPPPTRTQ